LGEVGRGNRKDIRNAVEAAIAGQAAWGKMTGHARAQVIYYIAENLAARAEDFADLISEMAGTDGTDEVQTAIARIFACAAWADKMDGQVHGTPFRGLTYTLNEPVGVLGVVCPAQPSLSGFVSAVMPAAAMGNAVVALPSEAHPLAATELYQVFDTSDFPGGVVNIVTGPLAETAKTLFEHDGVDGVLHFGDPELGAELERLSVSNLKQTWVASRHPVDYETPEWPDLKETLRHCTQVKNVWVPMGE